MSQLQIVPNTHDTPDRLLIPERLFGREVEINTLLTVFDRIVAGVGSALFPNHGTFRGAAIAGPSDGIDTFVSLISSYLSALIALEAISGLRHAQDEPRGSRPRHRRCGALAHRIGGLPAAGRVVIKERVNATALASPEAFRGEPDRWSKACASRKPSAAPRPR